jgi:hypothetical protein
MGAVAITSQKQPAASSGEHTQEIMEWIDFRRHQATCFGYYIKPSSGLILKSSKMIHIYIMGSKEKRALKQENQKLKNDIRVQKIINTKLRRNNATMMEAEADRQTELQKLKFTMKKLQEDRDMEIIETRHRREF